MSDEMNVDTMQTDASSDEMKVDTMQKDASGQKADSAKKPGAKKPGYHKKETPRLIDLLTDDGFKWRSHKGRLIVENPWAKHVAKGMIRHYGPGVTKAEVADSIGDMEFVGAKVKGLEGVSGEDVFRFSLAIFGAHALATFKREEMLNEDDLAGADAVGPSPAAFMPKEGSNGEPWRVVNEFAIKCTKGEFKGMANHLYPPWIRTPLNEGNEEATLALINDVYEARVRAARRNTSSIISGEGEDDEDEGWGEEDQNYEYGEEGEEYYEGDEYYKEGGEYYEEGEEYYEDEEMAEGAAEGTVAHAEADVEMADVEMEDEGYAADVEGGMTELSLRPKKTE
ncbi:hypothetical protein GGR56DRAFT_673669 [Xylariaceae sp. FL0804]|nr:hypothetical protein GGR56DRAFT_673669 [Xylariaceae sp. FL0804]